MADCDVLILGSGAAGLACAVAAAHRGLKVRVLEKEPVIGGTSAWSGGWLWIPRNPLARAEGVNESPEASRDYLRGRLGVSQLDDRLEALLEQGPAMVEFFQRHTRVQFQSGSRMPDMHDGPGAALGSRSLCAQPFDGRELGAWLEHLRPPLDLISLGGMGIAGGADLAHFLDASRSPRSAWYALKRLSRHWRDRVLHGRGTHLVNGNALVARLLRSALDLGVQIHTGVQVEQLNAQDGQIKGVSAWVEGARHEFRARQGVVLATGGCPHDSARLAQLLPQAPDHWSAAPPCNTGDGLHLAEQAGAVVDPTRCAVAWTPVSRVPRRDGGPQHFPHLLERSKPGYIAVLDNGQRFVNEADSYYCFMQALLNRTPTGETPTAWLICDHRALRRYGLGAARPFPFSNRQLRQNGYLHKAATLQELAVACGIDASGLVATVARFNAQAKRGVDDDFQRGASAYNRAQGEARHTPNPSLGALESGPFYAIKLWPGSLGTFAGLKTNAQARVLDAHGDVIKGLFAVGNDMASVMGGHYPSGGITLGPAMTFGYIAAQVMADEALRPSDNAAPSPRSSRDDAA